MICQVCGKNEATVEFTEIIDDEVKQLHLCDNCAKEKGIEMEQNFSISDLLAGISGLGEKPSGEELSVKCAKCGMTYEDFQKIGRLGCGECYGAFKKSLLPLLKRIHGSTRHIGKSPKEIDETDGKKKISETQELRQKLQRAIDMEEFEEAARLRDRIRSLEKKAKDKP
jgi:protein arginine kinase activator